MSGLACTAGEWNPGQHDLDPWLSSRLLLYPQMATDPIHGHTPWALVLVTVSVGKSAGKPGPVWGLGATFQP